MTKIIIAEDFEDYINELSAMLGKQERIEIVGTATNGIELLNLLKYVETDIIFMDIRMKMMDGLEATEKIKVQYPSIKIMILSSFNRIAYVTKAIQLGVDGYILKHEGEDILKCIDFLIQQKTYFSQSVIKTMATVIKKQPDSKQIELSKREKEVLTLIGNGLSSLQIANILCISTHTINSYRASLLEKFAASNVAEMVKKATLTGALNE